MEVQVDNESLIKMLNMKWLGMDTISNIDEEDAVGKGENYGSIMRRLKITGLDACGKKVHKNVVMKKAKVLPGDIQGPIFEREIEVYTEILPKMKELADLADKRTNLEIVWPICLGVRNYDVILLEDLVEIGYSMRNRRIPMSSNLGIFCAGQLGKFHALSLAAVKRKIIDPKILKQNLYASNSPVLNNIFSGGLFTLADTLESDPQWKSIVPKMRAIATNVGSLMVSLSEETKDEFPVINHGDCWSNNMLFKFSESAEEPCSMRFVDYQNVHFSCFAWDVTNFMHTSMSAQTRQPCYEQILENYRNSLIQTLEALHEDTSQVPSFDKMLQIMNKFTLFAFIVVCSLFPLTINTLEKPWELEKAVNEKSATHLPELYENEIFKKSFIVDAERFKSQGLF